MYPKTFKFLRWCTCTLRPPICHPWPEHNISKQIKYQNLNYQALNLHPFVEMNLWKNYFSHFLFTYVIFFSLLVQMFFYIKTGYSIEFLHKKNLYDISAGNLRSRMEIPTILASLFNISLIAQPTYFTLIIQVKCSNNRTVLVSQEVIFF